MKHGVQFFPSAESMSPVRLRPSGRGTRASSRSSSPITPTSRWAGTSAGRRGRTSRTTTARSWTPIVALGAVAVLHPEPHPPGHCDLPGRRA